jgi:hypothetical protein
MAKVERLDNDRLPEDDPQKVLYAFHCPPCGFLHSFDARWTFNGDFDRPTFSPSLLNTTPNKPAPPGVVERCHLHVRDGKIQYCGDCSHEMSGQTIEMEDV